MYFTVEKIVALLPDLRSGMVRSAQDIPRWKFCAADTIHEYVSQPAQRVRCTTSRKSCAARGCAPARDSVRHRAVSVAAPAFYSALRIMPRSAVSLTDGEPARIDCLRMQTPPVAHIRPGDHAQHAL